jgi:peptidyl-dipeptidase A
MRPLRTGAILLLFVASACARHEVPPATIAARAAPETADEFVARVNKDLTVLAAETNAAGYTQATFITVDTQLLNARATDRYLAYLTQANAQALLKLRLNVAAPAPNDAVRRARLTQLEAELEAKYGEGKYCPRGPASCKNLDQLSDILARSRTCSVTAPTTASTRPSATPSISR